MPDSGEESPSARSYAEILDVLFGNWEKSFEVVNAPLERKRRELAKRNDSINDYCNRYMYYFLPISARNAIFVHQIIHFFADSIWNTFQSQSSQPCSRCPKELYATGAQPGAFPVRILWARRGTFRPRPCCRPKGRNRRNLLFFLDFVRRRITISKVAYTTGRRST